MGAGRDFAGILTYTTIEVEVQVAQGHDGSKMECFQRFTRAAVGVDHFHEVGRFGAEPFF